MMFQSLSFDRLIIAIFLLHLAGCTSAVQQPPIVKIIDVPNSGLYINEYAAVAVSGRPTVLTQPQVRDDGSYSIVDAHAGPLESAEWKVVRGIRFDETYLAAHPGWIAADVEGWLKTTAPKLNPGKAADAFRSGRIEPASGERLYQLVALELRWDARRSLVPGSPTSGASIRFVNPRLTIFGSRPAIAGPADAAPAATLAWQVALSRPDESSGQVLLGSLPEEPSVVDDIQPQRTRVVSGQLMPALNRTSRLGSPWFANDPSVDHNLIVTFMERPRG